MSAGRKIRVLIVEDSTTVRLLLEEVVNADPRLQVVASLPSAEEALRVLAAVRPDVISLDIRLPGMNGIEATRRIMTLQPTPIVVVAASVNSEDLKISINALSAGALAVVEKPSGVTSADYATLAGRLCRQLVIMSDVSVIRQRRARLSTVASEKWFEHPVRMDSAARPAGTYRALGIVASTGGPNAVATLLQALGAGYPVPILLVQHITPSFLGGLVGWLNDVCPFSVVVARDGQPILAGHVYVPPPERHLELDGAKLLLTDGAPVSGQRPSGTVLFRSLARSLGNSALGVLLTGMGDDGAEGLRAMYDAGCHTIAEDETTAVVYGMPAVAVRLGAAREQLPLHRIGSRLREIIEPERMTI